MKHKSFVRYLLRTLLLGTLLGILMFAVYLVVAIIRAN